MTIRPPQTPIGKLAAKALAERIGRESPADAKIRFERQNSPIRVVSPDPKPEAHRERTSLAPAENPELGRLKKASEQVEAIFVKDLLGRMRKGLGSESKKDPMADLARDMMDQAIADEFGRTGALGISTLLYKNLSEAYLRNQDRTAETDETR